MLMKKEFILITKFIIISMHIAFMSCAPKVQDSTQKKPDVPELQTNDIALQQVYKNPFASINYSIKKTEFKKTASQTDVQNLFEISDKLYDPIANEKAVDIYNQLLAEAAQSNLIQTKEFKDTYYLQLVEEQTRKSLKNSVSDIQKKILSDTDHIEQIIDKSVASNSKKSTAQSDLATQIQTGQNLISLITKNINQADLFPELKKQILIKINSEADKFVSAATEFDQKMQLAPDLSRKLILIDAVLKDLEIELGTDTGRTLQSGKMLGKSIDQISTSINSLQTLALTWKMLTIEERDLYFKSRNQKLYDLLNKKSDADIQCLIAGNCSGLISSVVLNLGVYPALEEYGISKIKIDLNSAAMQFLNRKINSIVFEKLSNLPQTMKTQIRSGVEKSITDVQSFKDNFKLKLANGLKKQLKLNFLSMYSLTNTSKQKQIQLGRQLSENINQLYVMENLKSSEKQMSQISLIEKIIGLVDFSNQKRNLLKNGLSEYIKNPKELFLMSDLQNTENALRIKDQASALKFISLMLMATADWKSGSFDHGITDIRAQDLISDFKSDQLNQSLFPKVELFNICFSYAVQILKQIQSEKSLVYLVDNKNQRVPISDYFSGKNRPTVAMGAASNQKDNRTANVTTASDLAALIESLSMFIKITKDIQNSQSEIIKNPEFKNQIASANKNVQLLILTLANFLSSQMVDHKNLVADSYDFESQTLSENYNLETHVATISALIKAYEVTGLEIYLFSAKELYYSLNKYYFNPTLKFYKNNLSEKNEVSAAQTITSDVLNTLNQLIPIRKYLTMSSQVQFDRIFENWYVAILL